MLIGCFVSCPPMSRSPSSQIMLTARTDAVLELCNARSWSALAEQDVVSFKSQEETDVVSSREAS